MVEGEKQVYSKILEVSGEFYFIQNNWKKANSYFQTSLQLESYKQIHFWDLYFSNLQKLKDWKTILAYQKEASSLKSKLIVNIALLQTKQKEKKDHSWFLTFLDSCSKQEKSKTCFLNILDSIQAGFPDSLEKTHYLWILQKSTNSNSKLNLSGKPLPLLEQVKELRSDGIFLLPLRLCIYFPLITPKCKKSKRQMNF